jgi:hypothetical protein
VAGAGAEVEHHGRLEAHDVQPLEQLVAHPGLQHRRGVVLTGRAAE